MRKLLLLLLAIMSSITYAQTVSYETVKISGRVVSALTGDPIPYCQITYQPNRGTIRGSLGYFQLTDLHTGVYKVHFQLAGGGSSDTLLAIENKDLLGMDWPVRGICCELSRDSALSDISNSRLKLFLQSGDPPITYSNQKPFSKKYKVQFHDFGDLIGALFDCWSYTTKQFLNI